MIFQSTSLSVKKNRLVARILLSIYLTEFRVSEISIPKKKKKPCFLSALHLISIDIQKLFSISISYFTDFQRISSS